MNFLYDKHIAEFSQYVNSSPVLWSSLDTLETLVATFGEIWKWIYTTYSVLCTAGDTLVSVIWQEYIFVDNKYIGQAVWMCFNTQCFTNIVSVESKWIHDNNAFRNLDTNGMNNVQRGNPAVK